MIKIWREIKKLMGNNRQNIAIVIALFALIVSGFTYCYNTFPGEVHPFKPSGYSIIRGIDPHPSDHVLLPIEWENTGGRHELVRQPYLVLRERETGNNYTFSLAGEYPDISQNSLGKGYIIKESFILDPHSISPKVLVFHVDNWWNKSHEYYNFRFIEGENYNVSIGFQRNLDKQPEKLLFVLPMRSDIDILDSHKWEYWHIEYQKLM